MFRFRRRRQARRTGKGGAGLHRLSNHLCRDIGMGGDAAPPVALRPPADDFFRPLPTARVDKPIRGWN